MGSLFLVGSSFSEPHLGKQKGHVEISRLRGTERPRPAWGRGRRLRSCPGVLELGALGPGVVPKDTNSFAEKEEDLGFPLAQGALLPSALPSRAKEEREPCSSHPPPRAACCQEGVILMDWDTWLCVWFKGGQHQSFSPKATTIQGWELPELQRGA